jgi:hypothetical protein
VRRDCMGSWNGIPTEIVALLALIRELPADRKTEPLRLCRVEAAQCLTAR